MTIVCEVCGKEIKRSPIYVARYEHHYCSNICASIGRRTTRRGMKFSDEHRLNLSVAHKGLCIGKNHPMFGKYHSEQTRAKIKDAVKNKTLSEEHKKKISIAFMGKKHWNFGKHPSEETKKKMRESRLGAKSSLWKGGISDITRKRFTDYKWRGKAQEIRKRDNYTCQQCGVIPAYDVHHIIPYRLTHNDKENNLITLCRSCHGKLEYIFIDSLTVINKQENA